MWNRRDLMKSAAALVVSQWAAARPRALAEAAPAGGRKVIVVACGGIRREDSFADEGLGNIARLHGELLGQGTFYPSIRNMGATSHFNTISSMLSGNWQRLDDWGLTRPASPTAFEYLRRPLRLGQDQAWLISSNKALTSQIGASAVSGWGPQFGANVIFPKQLLINAVVHAAAEGRAVHSADRAAVAPELEAMLNRDNYDGLGWSVGEAGSLDTPTLGVLQQAIDSLIRTNAPVTGDEFTFLVSAEVMRRFAPSFLTITFSDMEVAHFGSYAMHLAGIRTVDRLASELWALIRQLPAYAGRTTLFVLPEFGRDTDGSTTNGFFNHRQNAESTRNTWMLALGAGVRAAQVVPHPVEHIDLCPTIARLFEVKTEPVAGKPLPGVEL